MGSYITNTTNAGLYHNSDSCIPLMETTAVIYELSQYNRVNVKIDKNLKIGRI